MHLFWFRMAGSDSGGSGESRLRRVAGLQAACRYTCARRVAAYRNRKDPPRHPQDLYASTKLTTLGMLTLAFGLSFSELYCREGLLRVDAAFLEFLCSADLVLHKRLAADRAHPEALAAKAESALILEVAPHLDRFISQLFNIADEVQALGHRHDEQASLFSIKRQFVQRRAASRIKPEEAQLVDGPATERELRRLFGGRFDELTFAQNVTRWLEDEPAHQCGLDLAMRYAAWALHTEPGREHARSGVLFKRLKTDRTICPPHRSSVCRSPRLSDPARASAAPRRIQAHRLSASLVALDETNYCIWCLTQGRTPAPKDCAKSPPPAGAALCSRSAVGVKLTGCPAPERSRNSRRSSPPVGRSPRWRSFASTARWPPRPATASATTA